MAEIGFALALILIAWQLGNGLGDKYRSHETTSLLEMPIWYGYAAALLMAYAAAFVATSVAYYRCMEQFLAGQINYRNRQASDDRYCAWHRLFSCIAVIDIPARAYRAGNVGNWPYWHDTGYRRYRSGLWTIAP